MRTAGARGSGGNLRVLRRDRVDVLLGHVMERARFWQPDAENTALDTGEPLDYQSAPVTPQRGPLHSSMTSNADRHTSSASSSLTAARMRG
jgi:hypothetical protein